ASASDRSTAIMVERRLERSECRDETRFDQNYSGKSGRRQLRPLQAAGNWPAPYLRRASEVGSAVLLSLEAGSALLEERRDPLARVLRHEDGGEALLLRR